jgi:hypothetical protein
MAPVALMRHNIVPMSADTVERGPVIIATVNFLASNVDLVHFIYL